MGCTSCGGGNKSAGKGKTSMPKSMSGRSKAKTYSTGGTSTFGKPRITFSAKNR